MRRRLDLTGLAILAALVVVGLIGYALFPQLLQAVQRMDCIAAGYGDCRTAAPHPS